jgi:MFS family permease
VLAQLFCTSLWFAGNAIAPELKTAFSMETAATGWLTSSVQFGFILGTLLFAILKVSDRFSPSYVFMICGLIAATANFMITMLNANIAMLFTLRSLTGLCLAGIYPVGMKIAADYHQKGLGIALGFLVGALVLGTASPHLFKSSLSGQDWRLVLYGTSFLSATGSMIIGLGVPNGPYRRKSPDVDLSAFFRVFQNRQMRASAFGYFGHMWELYTFWAFVPAFLTIYNSQTSYQIENTSFLSFIIIGVGGLSCVVGGYLSFRYSSRMVALIALSGSFLCCIASPWIFNLSPVIFILFLLLWGMLVIADSPQFSTLVAQFSPKESTGTALTIVNSLGFAITIVSIQLLDMTGPGRFMFLILIPGPLLGIITFYRGVFRKS